MIVVGFLVTEVVPGTLRGTGGQLARVANHTTGGLFQLRWIGPGRLDGTLDALAAFAGVAAPVVFFRGVRSSRMRTDARSGRLFDHGSQVCSWPGQPPC